MSDSPKYSTARVREAERERLLAEYRRQAEQRRARRAAEAERRRKERLQRRRAAVRSQIAEVNGRLAAQAKSPAGRHVAATLRELHASLERLSTTALADETQVSQAAKDLDRVSRGLEQAIAKGETIELMAQIRREEAVVLELRRLAARDRRGSLKFDPAGLQEFEKLLAAAGSQLERHGIERARQQVEAARQAFQRHRQNVEQQRMRWQQAKDAAEAALTRVTERLAGLQSDEVVRRWKGDELSALARRADQAAVAVKHERFTAAQKQIEAIVRDAEQLVASAEESQQREAQRQYVVRSIGECLRAFGFSVGEDLPQARTPGNAESLTTVRAERLDGRAITVAVPLDGEVMWSVDGYPMRLERATDGQPVRTCDEAETQITAINARLSELHGIETGQLRWAGQAPRRVRKTAKPLPYKRRRAYRESFGAR